jgi:hypothetical protein
VLGVSDIVTLLEGAYHDVPGETLPPINGDAFSYNSYCSEYETVMFWALHVDTVALPELCVETNPSIETLLKTKRVPEELYMTGWKSYVWVVLQPQSKFVGFFVSCEYE